MNHFSNKKNILILVPFLKVYNGNFVKLIPSKYSSNKVIVPAGTPLMISSFRKKKQKKKQHLSPITFNPSDNLENKIATKN